MSPQPISPSTSLQATRRPTTKNFNDMQSDDFFGLMIAQLQNQDPLKPTDNQTLLNQLSSIRQMEQSSTLTKTLTLLAAEQRFGSASSLIGRFVAGSVRDGDGNTLIIKGVVTGVRFDNSGRAILQLNTGHDLPADMVDQVTQVQNLPPDVQQQIAADSAATTPSTGQRVIQPDTIKLATTTPTYLPTTDDGLVGGAIRALFGSGVGVSAGV